MNIKFRQATIKDIEIISDMVVELTNEISELTQSQPFDINRQNTIDCCESLIRDGHYFAIIGEVENKPIAVATMTQTYALYAGGKLGSIQEIYISPQYRSFGFGALLIKQVQTFATQQKWNCIELCTPPLPEFERTLSFYQKNGLTPVGGRKMRQTIV